MSSDPSARSRSPSCALRVDDALRNPRWDDFLQAHAGHHLQSACWAAVKASAGWEVRRLLAERAGTIAGGAQVLLRRFPLAGAVGYVPRGPVLAEDDPELMARLLAALRELMRAERVHYLLLQPPAGLSRCAALLEPNQFRASRAAAAPTATALLDLRRSPAELLARMKPKTRYNVRLGLRKGVTIRRGTEEDLATFHHMLVETARRNRFQVQPLAHYHQVFRAFAEAGGVELLLAEYQGAALAGLMALAFGDTVTYWRGAWTGRAGALHPNEALHWTLIQWAQAQGYRWYDLDGVEPSQVPGSAQAAAGERLGRADTSFKLGFGADYAPLPGAFEHIANPALRWASATVLAASKLGLRQKVETHLRGMALRAPLAAPTAPEGEAHAK